MYCGMSNHIGNLHLLSDAVTRPISRRTIRAGKGAAVCELEDGTAKSAARDLERAGR